MPRCFHFLFFPKFQPNLTTSFHFILLTSPKRPQRETDIDHQVCSFPVPIRNVPSPSSNQPQPMQQIVVFVQTHKRRVRRKRWGPSHLKYKEPKNWVLMLTCPNQIFVWCGFTKSIHDACMPSRVSFFLFRLSGSKKKFTTSLCNPH
jgi:hypothetical protein